MRESRYKLPCVLGLIFQVIAWCFCLRVSLLLLLTDHTLMISNKKIGLANAHRMWCWLNQSAPSKVAIHGTGLCAIDSLTRPSEFERSRWLTGTNEYIGDFKGFLVVPWMAMLGLKSIGSFESNWSREVVDRLEGSFLVQLWQSRHSPPSGIASKI